MPDIEVSKEKEAVQEPLYGEDGGNGNAGSMDNARSMNDSMVDVPHETISHSLKLG